MQLSKVKRLMDIESFNEYACRKQHSWKLDECRELDGESLQFTPENLHRPLKRCLNFQARQAIRLGWISDKWDFADFFLEGMSGALRTKELFKRMSVFTV